LEIVKLLIHYGADLCIKDNKDASLLHFFTATGNYEMVKYLLINGANPNSINTDRETPLIWAFNDVSMNPEIIRLLINFGADPRIADNSGNTAFTILRRYPHQRNPKYQEILDILNSFNEEPIKEPEFY
jgi:ankyrin repeat protein